MASASRLLLPLLAVVALALAACTPLPVASGNNTSTNLSLMLPLGNMSNLSTSTPEVPVNSVTDQEVAARLTYTEGDNIALKSDAVSPDGVEVKLEFSKPFSSDGKWETKVGDAGEYPVTITARDARGLTSTQRILVTIKHANRAPVVSGPESYSVKEGEAINLRYSATDADEADQVVLSFSGWMKSDAYVTTFDDAGTYNVTVSASDGKLTTRKVVPITVANVNRAPVLSVSEARVEGIELDRITLDVTAEDPDGDTVAIAYGKPFDSRGRWTPQYDDAGEYTIAVTATDSNGEETVQNVRVLVAKANRPPVVAFESITVKENELIDLTKLVSISDVEGDEVAVTYSGWMTTSKYQTTYDDAGEHVVTITAEDEEGLKTTKDVKIVVEDVNRPPVFVRIA